MENDNEIIFFPYLFNDQFKSINFGNVMVWNFSLEADVRVPDPNLRDYIRCLLATNTDLGKPIQNIGIISIKGNSFTPLNRAEQKIVRELRAVLFISVVAASNIYSGENSGFFMVTTENFTVIHQHFKVGDIRTAYFSGSIVQRRVGGLKIDKIKYEIPPHVLRNKFSLDKNLLYAIYRIKR